jgi:hypothetical protein
VHRHAESSHAAKVQERRVIGLDVSGRTLRLPRAMWNGFAAVLLIGPAAQSDVIFRLYNRAAFTSRGWIFVKRH